ncbi:uncharacterized protein LOC131354787 isoform X3 [Hemibagrus wyckioides]|uniref:uncharacterized protein LOC131354787 isoform X2 n=1 Tax=Hemibagrus wyckioides TaxID=337641 RepID=UPI00266BCFC3|nr:uncharacterized protein LOC131354787 isoform X2 [Hemibagrus wyckioides]XP_058248801.1 uncharacterized protein LOC131354787 isoform X3 [Hemibagrus wyckioides]
MERFFQRLKFLIEDTSDFIKECAPSEFHPFINTCVLDSLLAAFHTAYIVFPNIAELLHRNDFFREVISLLNQKMYIEARILCVSELNHEKSDLFGNVKDYFPLIDKLVWPKSSPNDCEIIRKLNCFGNVFILGDPSDPPLILIHRDVPSVPSIALPPHFDDVEKKRIFASFFLLIGKDKHMTMCFQSSESTWHLYDNDPKKPSFQPFDPDDFKNYMICLVGYVNITQLEEYKGIPETGEGAGLSNQHVCPSQHFYQQQSVADVEMEDLSYSVSIPETGEGVGPRLFNQSRQDVYPNFSNQSQLVEDVEMLSCSSSDSD